MPDSLLCLGVITGAHGIKGEVKIKTFTESPGAIAIYGALHTRSGGASYRIDRYRVAKDLVIASLEGVTDRNAAEALKGTELCVRRKSLPELEDSNEFYHADLIGLRVELGDGSVFGSVVALLNFGAGDIIEIAPEGNKETVLFPFTRKTVPEVDIAKGRIIVALPDETE